MSKKIDSLEAETILLKKNFSEQKNENQSANYEINRLKQLDDDRQKHFETLLEISSNTSSHVGNKLDSIALLLGIVGIALSIGAIILSIYINRKEKK
ncbi:MAG: hypothetical protein IPN74_16290 [Haliscomenobacter sp.]|nr:hypothetical protein [Haliscomenobacter sp.]